MLKKKQGGSFTQGPGPTCFGPGVKLFFGIILWWRSFDHEFTCILSKKNSPTMSPISFKLTRTKTKNIWRRILVCKLKKTAFLNLRKYLDSYSTCDYSSNWIRSSNPTMECSSNGLGFRPHRSHHLRICYLLHCPSALRLLQNSWPN